MQVSHKHCFWSPCLLSTSPTLPLTPAFPFSYSLFLSLCVVSHLFVCVLQLNILNCAHCQGLTLCQQKLSENILLHKVVATQMMYGTRVVLWQRQIGLGPSSTRQEHSDIPHNKMFSLSVCGAPCNFLFAKSGSQLRSRETSPWTTKRPTSQTSWTCFTCGGLSQWKSGEHNNYVN